MHEDVEQILTRELRQVAVDLEVPPMPDVSSGRSPAAPRRHVWQPLLAAAAVVLIAVVAAVSGADHSNAPQPAPRPTEHITKSLPETVPDGPPTVPYLLDRVVHVGDQSYPDFDYLEGTTQGWVAARAPFVWWWGNDGAPQRLEAALEQPPGLSPGGEYLAYISTDSEMSAFRTDTGEAVGPPVQVPVRDDDGVGTRIGAVTDDGWVIASGRGVSILWRPFDGEAPIDLTKTAPGQLVWQATRAGLVVVDGSGDARDPGSGRVYLADLTADGELTPIAELPNFGIMDVSDAWVAWVPADQVVGDVTEYDEIQVRPLDGKRRSALVPPDGWRFLNGPFSFEDDQYLVVRVTDGQEKRMTRCSPALEKCVLLDAPGGTTD